MVLGHKHAAVTQAAGTAGRSGTGTQACAAVTSSTGTGSAGMSCWDKAGQVLGQGTWDCEQWQPCANV